MTAILQLTIFLALYAASVSATRAGLNLINDGSFEQAATSQGISVDSFGYVTASAIQTGANPIVGWQTTASDQLIEIWGSGFQGVPAAIGSNFFAELNALEVSTLFQVVRLDLAQPVSFSLAHRGRLGTDTMDVTIYDMGSATSWAPGQGTQVYSQRITTGNSQWGYYGADNMFTPSAGNYYAYTFVSVSSSGGPTGGNFIDNIQFGYGVNTVPEPGTWAAAALLAGGAAFIRWRKRAKIA